MRKTIAVLLTCILMPACLAACVTLPAQPAEPNTTDIPPVNMPNPASVYCEENGNQLEILTADDGSQSGLCVFPDGSTCDEWAYYNGECGPSMKSTTEPGATVNPTLENANGGYMAPGTSEPFADWWGVIKSTQPGAQYDDYFERKDLGGSIYFGIDSLVPEVEAQIQTLRDSGQIVHLYGTLFSNVPDYNGSQVQVDRIEVEGK